MCGCMVSWNDTAHRVGGVELVLPNLNQLARRHIGTQRGEAVHHQVGRVVPDPFHRDLDDARRGAVGEEFVGFVVGHQRGVVGEAQFPDDIEGGVGEVPRRRPDPDGPAAGLAVQHVGGAAQQIEFLLVGEQGVPFVDPAVHRHLVALLHVGGDLIRSQQRADGRDVERRRRLVAA